MLDLAHGHGVEASPSGYLRPRLMHSRGGIEVAEKPTPSVYLRLNQLEFLHNYQSLTLHMVDHPAHTTDYITNCRFDSDPALMKRPYRAQGADRWYSQQHVAIEGDASQMPFDNNTFRHAMLGIQLLPGSPQLSVSNCRFSDIYLAGILYGDDHAPDATANLTVGTSLFSFPEDVALPATSQLATTQATFSRFLNQKETVGISSLFVPTFVSGTRFEQLSTGNYPSFNYGNFRTRQVGLQGHKLKQITDNTFEGLHVGIAHVLRDGDTDTRVLGNRFSACEKGYAFLPVSSTAAPTQPTGTAYLSCNSFQRGVSASTRSGVSYGIYNEDRANVRVANPVPSGDPILKNLFDDAGAGAAGFYAIYNANSNANAALDYYTYRNYSQQIVPLVNGPQVQLTGVRAPDYMPGTACVGISLNGLQRTAAVTTDVPTATDVPLLEQNTPNPTQSAAHIAYHVPRGAQIALLLVRRGLDGRLMTSLPLAVAASRCEVKLAGYPAGTYFYTLVVDGVPSATRRLVVE